MALSAKCAMRQQRGGDKAGRGKRPLTRPSPDGHPLPAGEGWQIRFGALALRSDFWTPVAGADPGLWGLRFSEGAGFRQQERLTLRDRRRYKANVRATRRIRLTKVG